MKIVVEDEGTPTELAEFTVHLPGHLKRAAVDPAAMGSANRSETRRAALLAWMREHPGERPNRKEFGRRFDVSRQQIYYDLKVLGAARRRR